MQDVAEAAREGSNQFPAAFQNVMFSFMELMESATPEERLAVLSALTDVYCEHCGRRHDEGGLSGRCQCWNDE